MKYIKKFQTDTDYQAFKVGDDWITPNISVIEEKVSSNNNDYIMFNEVEIISTFTVSVNSVSSVIEGPYKFKEGMTWNEFLNSKYNNGKFLRATSYLNEGEVCYDLTEAWSVTPHVQNTQNSNGDDGVLLSDKIINGHVYHVSTGRFVPDEPM
jgi:cell division protein YceG involved in septum cleavage